MVVSVCSRATRAILSAALLMLCAVPSAKADELVEWFMWHELGKTVGEGVKSFNDYQEIRRSWDENIAAAKRRMEECGGCPEAKAELDKWQKVENDFNLVAGNAFALTNVPPSLAAVFGIDVPLAPYRSPEERQAECQPSRPKWVSERSEFCQQKSDELIACLRTYDATHGACTHDNAQKPGGDCWEEQKYGGYCYAEDYEAVERERKAQEARAQGVVIPDVVDDGIIKVIAYGKVPEDYMPDMPPPKMVRETIDGENTMEVLFRMRKTTPGALERLNVEMVHWTVVDFQSTCFEKDPPDEIGLRICEDLATASFDPPHPLVLECGYVGSRPLMAEGLYWYGERPTVKVMDPAYLLQRARNHPLLRVGDPRTDCPATIEEARALKEQYAGKIEDLAKANPQVSAATPWRSEREAERQRQYEERSKAAIEKEIAAFPFDGAYDAEFQGGFYYDLAGEQQHTDDWQHECAMTRPDPKTLSLDCTDRGKPYHVDGTIDGATITIRWKDMTVTYRAGQCGSNTPCLLGHDEKGLPRSNLFRKGDLTVKDLATLVKSLPIEGAYDLLLQNGTATATYRCRLKRDSRSMPNRFPTTCLSPTGARYVADGISREKQTPHLHYGPFDPGWLPVGDGIAEMMSFPFNAAWKDGDDPPLLDGQDRRGVSARLVRIGPEDVAWSDREFFKEIGTPIEAIEDDLEGVIDTARHNKIITVEQLAGLSDEEVKFTMGGVLYRDQARRYLVTHGLPVPEDVVPAAGAPAASAPAANTETADEPAATQTAAVNAKPLTPVEAPGRTGKWIGLLNCPKMQFDVVLLVEDVDEDVFWGTFEYLVAPGLDSPADGKRYFYGWQYRGTAQLKFAVSDWIKRSNMLSVSQMNALMDAGTMKVDVGVPGCSMIELTRVAATPDEIGELPKTISRTLDYGRRQAQKAKPPKFSP